MEKTMNIDALLDSKKQEEILNSVLPKEEKRGFQEDPTEYKCSHVDGVTATAKVWLLPNPHSYAMKDAEGNEIQQSFHTVSIFAHRFQEGNQKVWEPCVRKTRHAMTGRWEAQCGLCDYVKEVTPYRSDETEAEKNERKKRTASKLGTFVNVYVEEDKNQPEKVGKVCKMKIPWQLYDKLTQKLEGVKDANDENIYTIDPENIFALPKTRPIRLIAKKHKQNEKWNDYSGSEFLDREDFLGGDMSKIKAVLGQCHDLYADILKPFLEKAKTEDQMNAYMDNLFGTQRSLDKKETSEYNAGLEKALEKKEEEEEASVDDIPSVGTAVEEKTEEVVEKNFDEEVPAFNPDDF